MSEQAKELIKSRVGEILRGARKREGLKQEELAAELGITGNYVSMIERGEKFPSYDLLEQFSHQLEIRVAGIFLLAVLPDLEGSLETTHRLAELCSDINWVRVARDTEKLLELSEGLESVES